MSDDLLILSVNINRQRDTLLTILETTDASILLIQEPSWGRLVPKKSDDDPDGVEVKGTCNHPQWRMILPLSSPSDPIPHVAIFLHSSLTSSLTYSIIPAMNSYTCLGIQIDMDNPLAIINFYHHIINKCPHLQHLLSLPLPDGPLIIGGDFNTHSPCWSPPDLPTSPWASILENWLNGHDLLSLVPEGSITR